MCTRRNERKVRSCLRSPTGDSSRDNSSFPNAVDLGRAPSRAAAARLQPPTAAPVCYAWVWHPRRRRPGGATRRRRHRARARSTGRRRIDGPRGRSQGLAGLRFAFRSNVCRSTPAREALEQSRWVRGRDQDGDPSLNGSSRLALVFKVRLTTATSVSSGRDQIWDTRTVRDCYAGHPRSDQREGEMDAGTELAVDGR